MVRRGGVVILRHQPPPTRGKSQHDAGRRVRSTDVDIHSSISPSSPSSPTRPSLHHLHWPLLPASSAPDSSHHRLLQRAGPSTHETRPSRSCVSRWLWRPIRPAILSSGRANDLSQDASPRARRTRGRLILHGLDAVALLKSARRARRTTASQCRIQKLVE